MSGERKGKKKIDNKYNEIINEEDISKLIKVKAEYITGANKKKNKGILISAITVAVSILIPYITFSSSLYKDITFNSSDIIVRIQNEISEFSNTKDSKDDLNKKIESEILRQT